jgi:hypothetical protein
LRVGGEAMPVVELLIDVAGRIVDAELADVERRPRLGTEAQAQRQKLPRGGDCVQRGQRRRFRFARPVQIDDVTDAVMEERQKRAGARALPGAIVAIGGADGADARRGADSRLLLQQDADVAKGR